jgi:hypothetical protein
MLDPPTFSRGEKLVSVKRSHSGAVHGAASLPPTYHRTQRQVQSSRIWQTSVTPSAVAISVLRDGGESPSETPQLPHSRPALSITAQPREAQVPLSIAPPRTLTSAITESFRRPRTLLAPHDSRTCSRLHGGLCINTADSFSPTVVRFLSKSLLVSQFKTNVANTRAQTTSFRSGTFNAVGAQHMRAGYVPRHHPDLRQRHIEPRPYFPRQLRCDPLILWIARS